MTPDGRRLMVLRLPQGPRGMMGQKLAMARAQGLRMRRRPRTHSNIAGTVGIPLALGSGPRFVMPFGDPGLGEMWDQHLQGLEGFSLKKLKKGLKKVVKSKLFKYAAIAGAAYFAGPAIAAHMGGTSGAGGMLGKKAALKFLGGKALKAIKKRKKIAGGLLGTGILANAVGSQPGSVAAASRTPGGVYEGASILNPAGTLPGEYGYTPANPEYYQYTDAGAQPPTFTAQATPAATPPGAQLMGMDSGSLMRAGMIAAVVYFGYQAMGGGRRRGRR